MDGWMERLTSKMNRFSHKCSTCKKSRQTMKFTANAKIHGIREFLI